MSALLLVYLYTIRSISVIGIICNMMIAYMKLRKNRQITGQDFLIVNISILMIFLCVAGISLTIKDDFNHTEKYMCYIMRFFYEFTIRSPVYAVFIMITIFYCCPKLSKSAGIIAVLLTWIFNLVINISYVKTVRLEIYENGCGSLKGADLTNDKLHAILDVFYRLIPVCIFAMIILSLVNKREELKRKEHLLYAIMFGLSIIFFRSYFESLWFIYKLNHDHFSKYNELYYKIGRILIFACGIFNTVAYLYVDKIMYHKILILMRLSRADKPAISLNRTDIERNLNDET